MKYIVTILLLFISIGVFGRKADTALLAKAVTDFDGALLRRDTVVLKKLLSNDLSYGHSNGWVQKKSDVIGDLYNGKIIYKKIDLSKRFEIVGIGKNTASVRMTAEIDLEMNGKPLEVKLSVLQVWVWKNKHWELFARQSVKI